MKEHVQYRDSLLGWVVGYTEQVHGRQYDYFPPSFTFDEKPSEKTLELCRERARLAFDKHK
jgi:hypothetical protein